MADPAYIRNFDDKLTQLFSFIATYVPHKAQTLEGALYGLLAKPDRAQLFEEYVRPASAQITQGDHAFVDSLPCTGFTALMISQIVDLRGTWAVLDDEQRQYGLYLLHGAYFAAYAAAFPEQQAQQQELALTGGDGTQAAIMNGAMQTLANIPEADQHAISAAINGGANVSDLIRSTLLPHVAQNMGMDAASYQELVNKLNDPACAAAINQIPALVTNSGAQMTDANSILRAVGPQLTALLMGVQNQ